jgi:tetratricopeptide (TPR) repeat protein
MREKRSLAFHQAVANQRNYKTAEEVLKKVNSSNKASPDQIKQANLGLATVYLQWGKMEIEAGQVDDGLKHYDAAQALAPDLADYAQLKSQAGFLQVEALVKENDFNKALSLLNDQMTTATTEQKKIDILTEQLKVYDAYSKSDSKQTQALMNDTASKMCTEQLPTLPIFGNDPNNALFAFVSQLDIQAPDGWEASKPSELHYVVCIEQTQAKIQTCGPYPGGRYAYRIRYSWNTKLYDLTTGKLYQSAKLDGAPPRACQYREAFVESTVEIPGQMPRIEQVLDWLKALKLHE